MVRNGGEAHFWQGSGEIVGDLNRQGLQFQTNVGYGHVDQPAQNMHSLHAGGALLMRNRAGGFNEMDSVHCSYRGSLDYRAAFCFFRIRVRYGKRIATLEDGRRNF